MAEIAAVCAELKDVSEDAKVQFGQLSPGQLNWKPSEKSWSVAQCIDHLIVTHRLYFPLFKKLAVGRVRPTLWEKHSPLSGYFGRYLIKNLDPANLKPMKTTSKAYPAASEIDGDIIDRFAEHQQHMIGALRKLPDTLDPIKTIITSPLLALVTYSLDDTFMILTHHCRRHFNQAARVTESVRFPK